MENLIMLPTLAKKMVVDLISMQRMQRLFRKKLQKSRK